MADSLASQELPASSPGELRTDSLPTTTAHSEARSPTSEETPGTEVSGSDPFKSAGTSSHASSKEKARAKAATLSLREQVSLLRAADFWRTVPIPEKNIAQLKTTDGPNGARGAIFKAGTKVSFLYSML